MSDDRGWRRRIADYGGFALPIVVEAAACLAWLAAYPTVAMALFVLGAASELVVVVRSRGRPSFLFHCVACTLFAGLAAGAVGGPRAATLLLPAALACLLLGLGVAHRAAVRDIAARTLSRREIRTDEQDTTWMRDRAAIGLALPTVVLALLLAPIATWRFPSGGASSQPPSLDVQPGLPGGNSAAPPPAPSPARPRVSPAGPTPFPPNASGTGSPAGDESDDAGANLPPPHRRRPDSYRDRRVVMNVSPSRDGKNIGDIGPIYLRGLPVTQTGYRWHETIPAVRSIRDADDGRDDGWCELAVRPPAADRVDLAVHQELPVAAPGGGLVVYAPPGTAAVSLPRVRVEPGGVVLADRVKDAETFDYRLCTLTPSRVPFPGQIARVVGRESAASAPAASDAAAARLAALAQSVVANVSSPVDRVRAVVQHLRDHFDYDESGASLDDPAALQKLLAARSGSCTQFAQAGVVMLRAIGIPARVGTGFLANEWSDGKAAYVVRARDSHAWVEVAFEDCGWVIFDPTPREPPGAEDGRPEPGATDSPATGLPDDVPPPIAEGDGLEEVVGGVRGTIARIFDWICAHPWPCAAIAIAAAAVAVRAMRRRGRRLAGERVDVPSVRGPWDRLVTDLARRGHRRRASQTASEFAAAVVASAGDAYAPLLGLTARREAARFGARPLAPQDERAIEDFRATLRRIVTSPA